MKRDALRTSSGRVLYYWAIKEDGVHFEYQSRGSANSPLSMDVETKFTLPVSEYPKLYADFGIQATVSIRDALEQINVARRGRELDDAFGNSIAIVDEFVWMN